MNEQDPRLFLKMGLLTPDSTCVVPVSIGFRWIPANTVGYGVAGCVWVTLVPRRDLEWSHRTGRLSRMLGCALGFIWVWLAASLSRVAWDCSLKSDVYPSQGGIQTWDR